MHIYTTVDKYYRYILCKIEDICFLISYNLTLKCLISLIQKFSITCRWLNKMGLAAISYDASGDVTTSGFAKPTILGI